MPDIPTTSGDAESHRPHRTRNRWLAALGITLGVLLIAFVITGEYVAHHLGPILRSSVVDTLSDRFHSPVELDSLDVSVANGLEVDGRGLRIFYLAGPSQPDLQQKLGKSAPPMLSVNHFSFRTSLHSLLHLQANIARVDIDGMDLHIPPHSGAHTPHVTAPNSRIKITVAKIYCKNVNLVIETANPAKSPLTFAIQDLKLTDVGPGQPMLYDAFLINPKPVGDIHATGHFGPWHSDDPRSTSVDGHYTFTNADLGTIKGIGGTLSSTGDYTGRLDHITIDGTTTTPNFSLDISDHPVPLETTFHAYVDGTNGDTTLDPVQATLAPLPLHHPGHRRQHPRQGPRHRPHRPHARRPHRRPARARHEGRAAHHARRRHASTPNSTSLPATFASRRKFSSPAPSASRASSSPTPSCRTASTRSACAPRASPETPRPPAATSNPK